VEELASFCSSKESWLALELESGVLGAVEDDSLSSLPGKLGRLIGNEIKSLTGNTVTSNHNKKASIADLIVELKKRLPIQRSKQREIRMIKL
jgi:hypothetical protein